MSVRPGKFARWTVVAAFLCFGSIGCSGGKSTVRGKVTHNGKTVVWGTVTLMDSTGAYHQGNIDLSGNYQIENVPSGQVRVAVYSPDPEPKARGEQAAKGGVKGLGLEDPREKFIAEQGGKQGADRPKPPAGAWFPIPHKFSNAAESGLTGDVKGKDYELNLDLK